MTKAMYVVKTLALVERISVVYADSAGDASRWFELEEESPDAVDLTHEQMVTLWHETKAVKKVTDADRKRIETRDLDVILPLERLF